MARLLALLLGCGLALPLATSAAAQQASDGIFAGAADVGAALSGSTVYDPATGSYRVTGGGDDMWGAADAFRFTWMRFSGDGVLTADIQFPPGTKPPNEKAVLLFRQSLAPPSAYADVAIHADGHITLQYRASDGGVTADTTATQHGSTTLSIERKGNHFTAYASTPEGKMVEFASTDVALQDPVYVGLGVCAHDAKGLATVTFSNVRVLHLVGHSH